MDIDTPQFSFSEFLKMTGLSRGAAEGYMQRGIVTPSQSGKGSGKHRKYCGRDVIRFAAVKYLGDVGVAPSDISWFVSGKDAVLDRVVDSYQESGDKSEYAARSPYVLKAKGHALYAGGLTIFDDLSKMASELRKDEVFAYVVFDAFLVVRVGFEVVRNHLEEVRVKT